MPLPRSVQFEDSPWWKPLNIFDGENWSEHPLRSGFITTGYILATATTLVFAVPPLRHALFRVRRIRTYLTPWVGRKYGELEELLWSKTGLPLGTIRDVCGALKTRNVEKIKAALHRRGDDATGIITILYAHNPTAPWLPPALSALLSVANEGNRLVQNLLAWMLKDGASAIRSPLIQFACDGRPWALRVLAEGAITTEPTFETLAALLASRRIKIDEAITHLGAFAVDSNDLWHVYFRLIERIGQGPLRQEILRSLRNFDLAPLLTSEDPHLNLFAVHGHPSAMRFVVSRLLPGADSRIFESGSALHYRNTIARFYIWGLRDLAEAGNDDAVEILRHWAKYGNTRAQHFLQSLGRLP